MRVLGGLLVGAVILAALKAALVGVALVMTLVVVVALCVRPRETLAILLALALINGFAAQPALGFVFFTALFLAGTVARRD